MQVVYSVLGIILFICLVLVHEWGHFMAARRNGVAVEEFGLGFPPRAWTKRLKSGLILSLNWLPLGGFVRLHGEHDDDKAPGSFGAASLKTKTKILLAGVGMNLLFGILLLTILALVGMPKIVTKDWSGTDQFTIKSDTKITKQEVRVADVQSGSPAAAAGLKIRDQIDSINGIKLTSSDQLHNLTGQMAGEVINLRFEHNGKPVFKEVRLRSRTEVNASLNSSDPKGYLGVEPTDLQIQRSTWSAPITAIGFTGQMTWLTLKGIGHAFGGLGSAIAGLVTANHAAREAGQSAASSQVGGPVAVANILWGSGALGLNFVLMIIAVISLTLAIVNVLPIPALDGGRLAVIWLSRLWRRRLPAKTEDLIHGVGMVVLLALFVLITIADVHRF